VADAEKDSSAPSISVTALAAPGALESGEQVENFASDENSETYKEAAKLYELIVRAYDNQQERADNIREFWSIYQAKPDTNQQYTGNSQCYVPTVRDCINSRAKRRLKQLFPTKHRHVEAVGSDPETPYPQLALAEHYIRSTRLKQTVRSVLVAGDVTGQWNLYLDWTRSYRRITEVVKKNPALDVADPSAIAPGEEPLDLSDPTEEEEETQDSDVMEEGPEITDFADEDLAVVPPTVNDIEKAKVVALRLRMSQDKVNELIDEGVFVLADGQTHEQLWEQLESMSQPDASMQKQVPPKMRSNDAGIKTEGTFKYLLAFEATARLTFEEEGGPVKRLAYIYYAGQNNILGIVKAPQWSGKRPVISAPVERVAGSFKGISKIEPVKFLQWNLNDFWNMGQDSAMFSLLPIVMTDPLANPNYASMVIGLAAVWSVDPNKTKFASMPQLYKEAIPLCDQIKRQIWESMDVNELMMGRMPQGRKNNQLMGAMQQEQMTNIMDDAEYFEEAILTPVLERVIEYDRQFRTDSLTVVTKGEIGERAKMTQLQPQQFGERYRIQWAGTNIVASQQLQQLRIAGMNVLRGIPPQQLNGRKLDVTPILEKFCEDLYGPELAPKILIDERNLFTISAEVENEMMHNGLPVDVHEADNDQEHIVSHMSAARMTGDTEGRFRAHIAKHTMKMQAKLQMQMAQAAGAQGVPGGGQPGVPGSPRMGGAPQGPSGPANPPGLIHPDQAPVAGRG
jgi:hypothetical protein